MNLIFRILKSQDIRLYTKAYITLIRPVLEHGSIVIAPISIRDVNILEGVQRVFTRRTFYRCKIPADSYKNRLICCKLDTLERRRILADVTMVYKIVNNLVDIQVPQLFRAIGTRTRGHSTQLYPLIRPTNNLTMFDFAAGASKLWNALPANFTHVQTLNGFKRTIRSFDFSAITASRIRC